MTAMIPLPIEHQGVVWPLWRSACSQEVFIQDGDLAALSKMGISDVHAAIRDQGLLLPDAEAPYYLTEEQAWRVAVALQAPQAWQLTRAMMQVFQQARASSQALREEIRQLVAEEVRRLLPGMLTKIGLPAQRQAVAPEGHAPPAPPTGTTEEILGALLRSTAFRPEDGGKWRRIRLRDSHTTLYLLIRQKAQESPKGVCALSVQELADAWPDKPIARRWCQRLLFELCEAGWIIKDRRGLRVEAGTEPKHAPEPDSD